MFVINYFSIFPLSSFVCFPFPKWTFFFHSHSASSAFFLLPIKKLHSIVFLTYLVSNYLFCFYIWLIKNLHREEKTWDTLSRKDWMRRSTFLISVQGLESFHGEKLLGKKDFCKTYLKSIKKVKHVWICNLTDRGWHSSTTWQTRGCRYDCWNRIGKRSFL